MPRTTPSKPAAGAPRTARTQRTTRAKAAEPATRPRRKRSAATRQEIIEATIECFVQIGYARTTTTEIAKLAGYTRGAVQHYFPTTEHVLKASISYLTKAWLDGYMNEARNTPPGTDYVDFAVDTLWRFVNDRKFVAWQELVSASRTDKALRRIIVPAAAKFERLRREMGQANYPELAGASRDAFERNRDTLRFVLEGISTTILTYDKEARIKAQLDWLKESFHTSLRKEMHSTRTVR